MKPADLVVAGGRNDPNLNALAGRAHERGLTVTAILIGRSDEPRLAWHMDAGTLTVDGRIVEGRSAFIRYDVFNAPPGAVGGGLDRALAWYSAVASWCLAQQGLRMVNRGLQHTTTHKGHLLARARARGLPVPRTLIGNDRDAIAALGEASDLVAKPVAGGAYCMGLADALAGAVWDGGVAPLPATVQEKLSYPEFRIYLIGGRVLAFRVTAGGIDSRVAPDARIVPFASADLDAGLVSGLAALADESGVDFCAFDLKTRDGAPCLLEMNTDPMFAAYDRIAGGALSDAILDFLTEGD